MMRKVVVLVCILSLLVIAAVLVGCGSGGNGGNSSETPEEVAKAFWKAALKHDVDTTWSMFSEIVQSGFENKAGWEKSLAMNDPKATVEVGKATITGDSAKVSVKIMSGGQEIYKSDTLLVKEGGVWKIEMM